MSIDVLPSCSQPSAAALFDHFSAQLAASMASSPPPTGGQRQQQHSSSAALPPSPPPGRAHRKKFDPNSSECRFVQNAVAMAVLARLHRWCCQLFWLTIVCLIGVCSEQKGREDGGAGDSQQAGAAAQRARTFHEVRKSIVQASQRRGCKTLQELEMQLLRHLTCPQTAVLRPLRPSQHKKRHFLSRPPSPQLFDISEETE